MDRPQKPMTQLAWLAFAAQQRGWHGLAKRIAEDAAKLKRTEQQILQSQQEFFRRQRNLRKADSDADSHSGDAA
jgi:hypothetical protein